MAKIVSKGCDTMEGISRVESIKLSVESNVGKRVRIVSGRGKRHKIVQSGIIEKAYPSIFVIKLDENFKRDRMSVSYADVLTKTVQLALMS